MEFYLAENPEIPLAEPDQFVFGLSRIDKFDDRLDCFVFKVEFPEMLGEIKVKLNELEYVCQFLLKSDSLRNVLW